MPVRQVDILEILHSSKVPLKFDDIVDRLNLDPNYENTLKTTPKKRVSVALRRLEGRDLIKCYKFGLDIYYKHTGEMIKNLIVQVMISNLNALYKTEFMKLMTPVLTEENREIINKEIEIYKIYLKDKNTTERKLEAVREKTERLVFDSKNTKDYFI